MRNSVLGRLGSNYDYYPIERGVGIFVGTYTHALKVTKTWIDKQAWLSGAIKSHMSVADPHRLGVIVDTGSSYLFSNSSAALLGLLGLRHPAELEDLYKRAVPPETKKHDFFDPLLALRDHKAVVLTFFSSSNPTTLVNFGIEERDEEQYNLFLKRRIEEERKILDTKRYEDRLHNSSFDLITHIDYPRGIVTTADACKYRLTNESFDRLRSDARDTRVLLLTSYEVVRPIW